MVCVMSVCIEGFAIEAFDSIRQLVESWSGKHADAENLRNELEGSLIA